MKLSPRLQAIADFVPKNSIVADIGTDHGYIPRYLIEENISKVVIATDVSQGSLDKTIKYINESIFDNVITARLGDGLDVIKPFEVDTVVIAGMGGLLIRDILNRDRKVTNSINNFILQPMVASKELREYLLKNGYTIVDEELVNEEDKYYEIIFAKAGKELIEKEIYFEISKRLIEKKHPLLKELINTRIESTKNILRELSDKETIKSKERIEKLKKNLEDYMEVLKEIES